MARIKLQALGLRMEYYQPRTGQKLLALDDVNVSVEEGVGSKEQQQRKKRASMMAKHSFWRVALGAWALMVLLLSPVSTMGAENLKKVIVAIPSITIHMSPLWIAQETGIFKEERLDVEVTYIRGNTTTVQALLAGQIQAGYGGAAAPIGAYAGGGDVVIVSVVVNKLGYMLILREPIKEPSDLNGKRFAISGFGGSSEVATRAAIEAAGADPNRATMIVVGGSSKRLAALQSGSVDAAIILGPTFVGRGEGLHMLLDLSETDVEYSSDTIFTMRKFASNNRDAVLGLVRGFTQGVRFFQRNKEETLKIVGPHLKSPKREILERQWQHVVDHTYEYVPYPTRRGFQFVANMLAKKNAKVASVKMEDVFDVSYLNELLKERLFTRRAIELGK